MRKAFIISVPVLLVFLALPTLKNIYLYYNYEHGREYLERQAGKSGKLWGIWSGTFDTYQHGIDERHQLMFVIAPDSTGKFEYLFYTERYITGSSNLYNWEAVFPYDRSKAATYSAQLTTEGQYLIIEPSENWFVQETQYMKYKLSVDRLFISPVDTLGDQVVQWGIPFSWPDVKVKPIDLVEMWW